jgi:antitoxin CptB
MTAMLDSAALSRLRWRCRRGLLENDLFIERFFQRHGDRISVVQGEAMEVLMDLADNDLLDLILERSAPEGPLDRPDIRELLAELRRRPSPS